MNGEAPWNRLVNRIGWFIKFFFLSLLVLAGERLVVNKEKLLGVETQRLISPANRVALTLFGVTVALREENPRRQQQNCIFYMLRLVFESFWFRESGTFRGATGRPWHPSQLFTVSHKTYPSKRKKTKLKYFWKLYQNSNLDRCVSSHDVPKVHANHMACFGSVRNT